MKKYKSTDHLASDLSIKKKVYSMAPARNKHEIREVGDIWEEHDLITDTIYVWEQKKGYRVKTRKNSEIFRDIREYQTKFYNCPKEKCDIVEANRLDDKCRKISGMCADCHFEHETKMKMDGTYKEFALKRMQENVKAFLKDAELDVAQLKQYLSTALEFVEEDGQVEKWDMDSKDTYLKKIEDDFKEFKKSLLQFYEIEDYD